MEDVVLHYQPGSAAGLSCLLERTERLLDSFPCRTPPVFRPWFSSDRHPPIRPVRPAPVITGPAGLNQLREPEVHSLLVVSESPHCQPPPENPPEPEEAACVSETPKHLLPQTEVSGHKDGSSVTDSPLKRSWSVFTRRGGLQSESMSRRFRHVVSVHRLHLHQRAKWVIGQHNCGGGRDIEQVWCSLSRCVRSSGPPPPPCNANIRRERLEIWVFCDVVLSEQVGRYLKEELQLSGGIDLSVLGRGNVFSM